jgi:hypothetical protein
MNTDHSATLAHYTEQAALAGDAHHLAVLIRRHPSYSAQELAVLITALSAHAAHMANVGLNNFDVVCESLDKAADLADESYLNPELVPFGEATESDFGAFKDAQ